MTTQEFNDLLKSNEYICAKCSACWCGPCKTMGKTIDDVKGDYPNINFIEIDIEESPEIASEYKVRSIPTVLYIKNGEVKDKSVGNIAREKFIEKLTALTA